MQKRYGQLYLHFFGALLTATITGTVVLTLSAIPPAPTTLSLRGGNRVLDTAPRQKEQSTGVNGRVGGLLDRNNPCIIISMLIICHSTPAI